jgi:hypothetical protein
VDYLGSQGYWVCALVAVLSAVILAISGHPIVGVFVFLFYYLGGVGVRERSRDAAAVVFVMMVADRVAAPSVLRLLFADLLLSNFRATWIAAKWKPESDEAILPPRFSQTWSDKFADSVPTFLWPKVRVVYSVFSAGFLAFVAVGWTVASLHRHS